MAVKRAIASRPTVEQQGAPQRSKVPALERGVGVVRYLNTAAQPAAGVSEIAKALGLTKSQCFNILRTLQALGWVAFDGERRRYALAPRLLADVSRLLAGASRGADVQRELQLLSRVTGVPCVLTSIEPDGSFVAVGKAEEAAELVVSVPIGHRFPADAPAQMRARLAWSDPATRALALDAWVPVAHTPRTIVDRAALEAELAATRRRGYAISRAEFTPGVMSLATPILDDDDVPWLILQCPGVEPDVAAREASIAAAMMQAAARIGTLLQGRRPISADLAGTG